MSFEDEIYHLGDVICEMRVRELVQNQVREFDAKPCAEIERREIYKRLLEAFGRV